MPVHLEFQAVTTPITAVESTLLQTPHPGFIPGIVGSPILEPHITTTEPDPLTCDTRPVGLTGHRQSKATVQHVIPGIELGDRVGIDPAEEVADTVRHVHD